MCNAKFVAGRRYNRETLEITYKGKNIADVLDLTIDEAARFFRNVPSISDKLNALLDVGLGYLQLGQAGTTLSGGEAQRVKLATELAKKATGRTIYILDEPTTGLHFADIEKLLQVLMKLRDAGNTLIVIEHNLEMIKVRGLDHRSRSGRRRTGRRHCWRRSAGEDCRSSEESHRDVSAAALGQKMNRIGATFLVGLLAVFAPFARAEFSAELAKASAPLAEGVPEVAVARLQTLLNHKLPEPEWRATAEKLAEAQIAARQPLDALKLLEDPRLRNVSSAQFCRAQALAGLDRWKDALPLYEKVAAGQDLAMRAGAVFGAGEMLRALGRDDEALHKFLTLFRDPQWSVRAQLRAAEIYLDKSDATNAKRLLDKLQPKAASERKTRHFLRGRLEMVDHHPERAIPVFESLLKKPQGASHSILTAALFSIADAHLQLKTAETGDDVLEDFIEHHPNDVDLARIFAKLDELYRAQRKPSRSELERWIARSRPAETQPGPVVSGPARSSGRTPRPRAANSLRACAARAQNLPRWPEHFWILPGWQSKIDISTRRSRF